MKKHITIFIFIIILVLTNHSSYSQSKLLDSLNKVVSMNKIDSPTVSAYLNLGKYYRNAQDSTSSADNSYKALALAKKIDFKRGIALSYIELGYLYELTADLPKAKSFYNNAIQYTKKNQIKKELALVYSYMFFIYSLQSEYTKAIAYADSAANAYKVLNRNLDVANQYNNIGIMYYKQNKNVEAIKYYQAALSVFENIGQSVEYKLPNTLNNIGLVFEALKSHDQAITYFNRVIPLSKKYKLENALSEAYNGLGNVYLNTKKYQKALYYYQLSLPLALKSNQTQGIAIAYANLSITLTNLKNYKKAEEYLKISDAKYKSINNLEGIISNQINYSQLLAKTDRLSEAEKTLNKAMAIARKNNFTVLIQNIYESMAEISKLKGEFNDAYAKQDSAYKLQEKNFNFDTNKQIADLEVKYKTTQKEKEILAAKSDLLIADAGIQKRNLGLTIALSLILILGSSAFFISRNAKLKQQKAKEEAALQLILATTETKNQLQAEKLRISQELHDNIGAQLSFINSNIGTLSNQDQANEQLKETQIITQNTIRELRSTVWLINQQEFSLDEFIVKLRDYVKPYHTGKPHINIEDLSAGNIVLAPITATNLFRILQEIVNNTIKHADATLLNITFKNIKNELELLITDNGKGFDLDAKANGYGLKNINSRVQNIKGNYQIESKIGEGTQTKLNIPV
jgi:signal transduction histidine kinase